MSKLILFGGDLASGKSTYSNIIGEKFNITVINKDRLKEILGDIFIAKNREENLKLSKASFEIMKYEIEKNKDILLLESNFKDYEMEEIYNLINIYNIEVLSFVFKGDNKILHERFMRRLNENRHYVHKAQDFTNIEDFIKTLDNLRKVKYPGIVIDIDSSNFDYQKDEKLLKIISNFIEAT